MGKRKQVILLWALAALLLSSCTGGSAAPPSAVTLPVVQNVTTAAPQAGASLDSLPAFLSETPWVEINGNEPYFTEADYTTDPFETYAELDSLGRCGVAYANVCQELMPTEERGSIGSVKPSGWQSVKYSSVDGGYLYNRCHLIGFQLAGENANKQNLITGTRYLNIEGMLPFENMVADYVKETDAHVLYRVTPIYTGNNLVANGVLLEGYSVEDEGDGICFCVYAYNAQPGIAIDYATGESWEDAAVGTGATPSAPSAAETTYILNTSSKKFHLPDCGSTEKISAGNKETYTGTREDLVAQGYEPCGACKP